MEGKYTKALRCNPRTMKPTGSHSFLPRVYYGARGDAGCSGQAGCVTGRLPCPPIAATRFVRRPPPNQLPPRKQHTIGTRTLLSHGMGEIPNPSSRAAIPSNAPPAPSANRSRPRGKGAQSGAAQSRTTHPAGRRDCGGGREELGSPRPRDRGGRVGDGSPGRGGGVAGASQQGALGRQGHVPAPLPAAPGPAAHPRRW